MKFVHAAIVVALFAIILTGCQKGGPGDTAAAVNWTTYNSPNESLKFEYPAPLRRKDHSAEPVGFLLERGSNDLAIVVMHGHGEHDGDFAESMISLAVEDAKPIGKVTPVTLGSAKGLRQDYRIRDGSRFRLGSTIAVASGNERLVFDVSYPERWHEEFGPAFSRIVDSLQFRERLSTTTQPVSINAANHK